MVHSLPAYIQLWHHSLSLRTEADMEWPPVLDKEISGARVQNCGHSGRRSARYDRRTVRLGGRNNDVYCDCMHFSSGRSSSRSSSSKIMGWTVLWRRINKERCRIFQQPKSVSGAYDPYTYAQNFDQGSASFEPDNLSRSFSARFARPPRDFSGLD